MRYARSQKTKIISDCCLTPNSQFFNYIMARASYIRSDDDDDVYFILRQHAQVDFYSPTSLKLQTKDRHYNCQKINDPPPPNNGQQNTTQKPND